MTRTGRTLTLLGMGIAAAMIMVLSPKADEAPNFINPDGLVIFEEHGFRYTVEDWVSLEPTASHTVKKIGYGQVTRVGVATTATGTYSTDGLTSPHVSYPGIEVERVPGPGTWSGDGGIRGTFVPGRGLVSFRAPLISGASFIHIVGSTGGKLVSTPSMSCYSTGSFTVC